MVAYDDIAGTFELWANEDATPASARVWTPSAPQPAPRPTFPGLLGNVSFEDAKPTILHLMQDHIYGFCEYLKDKTTPAKVLEKDPTKYLRDYTLAVEFINKLADAHETSSEEGRLGYFYEDVATHLVQGDKHEGIQSLGIDPKECEVEIEEGGTSKRVFLPCIDNICVTLIFVFLLSNKTSKRGANYKERRDQSRYIPEGKELLLRALRARGSSKQVVTILGQANSGVWGKEKELGCDFLLYGRDYAATLTGDPDFFLKVQQLWWTGSEAERLTTLLKEAREVLRSNMWFHMFNNRWIIGNDPATAKVDKDAMVLWKRAYEQPAESFRKFCDLVMQNGPPSVEPRQRTVQNQETVEAVERGIFDLMMYE